MKDMKGCLGLVSCVIAVGACSGSHSTNDGDNASQSGGMAGATSGSSQNVAGTGGTGQRLDTARGLALPMNGEAGAPVVCASSSQSAKLRPLYLAFVFDQSGSMGELDYPWHDPVLKWDPVVAATRSFFESERSAGIYASLTLFPKGEDSCNSETYTQFDVPMTPLPTSAMGEVLSSIGTPPGQGTPTRAAIQGTLEQVLPMAASNTSAKYALVLVTDGTPASCTTANSVAAAAATVQEVAATLPTYVIGVENPPLEGAPDNVSGLHAIAEAGGTSRAFIIETGDPARTVNAFTDAISLIRGASLSCNVDLPTPPQGRELNPRRVKVLYSTGASETPLTYDPACQGQSTWYYDNPTTPREIRLCPAACDVIRGDADARLSVEFACEDVIFNI